MDIVNFFTALASIIVGVILLIYTNSVRVKDRKDEYGAHVKMYFGSIGFIVLGVIILFKEIF